MRLRSTRAGATAHQRRVSPWGLDLDFTSGVLDSRVTFTRPSMATMFNAAGQLVYAPHNLALWSEDISNAAWAKVGAVVPVVTSNAGLAPDQSNTASLIDLTPASDCRVAQTYSNPVPSGFAISMSVWLRAEPGQSGSVAMQVRRADASTSTTLLAVTDQWQRFTWTVGAVTGATTALWWIANRALSGHTLNRVFVWGAQIEYANTVGEYRKTTSLAYHGPRFTHDPVTRNPLGLLLEPSGTNSCLHSANLADAVWTKTFVSLGGSVASPVGAAVLVVPSTANSFHNLAQSVVNSAGATTVSFVAKASGYGKIAVREGTATGAVAVWDVAAGTVFTAGGTATSITALGGDWYRCSMTWTATAGARTHFIYILDEAFTGNSPHTFQWIGNGASGIFVTEVQVETGDYASSLISTAASAVTRAADVARIEGAAFASLFSPTEGTCYVESRIDRHPGASSFPDIFRFGVSANLVSGYFNSASLRCEVVIRAAGANQAVFTRTGLTPGVPTKIAVSYAANSSACSISGSAATTDVDCALPAVTPTALHIGCNESSTNQLGGTVARLRLSRSRLPNAELQAMTG